MQPVRHRQSGRWAGLCVEPQYTEFINSFDRIFEVRRTREHDKLDVIVHRSKLFNEVKPFQFRHLNVANDNFERR